jgi:hypothetical protein
VPQALDLTIHPDFLKLPTFKNLNFSLNVHCLKCL